MRELRPQYPKIAEAIRQSSASSSVPAPILHEEFEVHIPMNEQIERCLSEGANRWRMSPLGGAPAVSDLPTGQVSCSTGERVFADETTVPVLVPKRTRTVYAWVAKRDNHPYGGTAIVQMDRYVGCNPLFDPYREGVPEEPQEPVRQNETFRTDGEVQSFSGTGIGRPCRPGEGRDGSVTEHQLHARAADRVRIFPS